MAGGGRRRDTFPSSEPRGSLNCVEIDGKLVRKANQDLPKLLMFGGSGLEGRDDPFNG